MITYFNRNLPQKYTEGLLVFRSNLMQSLNFMYENLVMVRSHSRRNLPEKFEKISLPGINYKGTNLIKSDSVDLPDVKIAKRRKDYSPNDYPRKLFNITVVQIVSDFEVYIKDTVEEIYTINERELLATDERQITSRDIVNCDDVDELKNMLIDSAVSKFTQASYPNLVDMFERKLHVGLHKRKGDLSQFEIHHFIETRNIILHNNARSSENFRSRMKIYGKKSPFKIGHLPEPFADFDYVHKFSKKLYEFVCFIDSECAKKWKMHLRPIQPYQ